MTFGQNQPMLQSQSDWLSFKMPREYGAIVVFILASIVALVLSQSELVLIACLLVGLWPLILSAHRPQQLLLFTVVTAITVYCCAGLQFALWLISVGLGIFAVSSSASVSSFARLALSALARESLGLAGAALAPLIFAFLLAAAHGQELDLPITAIFALLAATLTSSTMIYLCRFRGRSSSSFQQRPAVVLLALISLWLWLCLASLSSSLAALSLLVYVLQGLWLLPARPHSYKQLGQVQCLCLTWVSTATVLYVLQVLT